MEDHTWPATGETPYNDRNAASPARSLANNTADSSTTTPQRDNPSARSASTQQAYDSPSIASRAASLAISSPSAGESGARNMDYNGDYDGDMPMEDADPFNRQKYARPPTKSNRTSQYISPGPARRDIQGCRPLFTHEHLSCLFLRVESATAVEPLHLLHPSTAASAPFSKSTETLTSHLHNSNDTTLHLQPQRAHNLLNSPRCSRTCRHLPTTTLNLPTQQLNAMFGTEPQSPKHPQNPMSPASRGAVPQFAKVNDVASLEPRINAQPPFRRADPEGGFISPLQALTTHLPATYRICNPTFQYESSRNPRRVLTKPSKGIKNDGYDNEDSDYILYVNDILGSEETNHKNRYLILDVLGQGTFGQVVKCQNLKTQEVVAVKVVKNKTAYFNQSMMEVSVLDLLNGRMDKNDDHHILRLKDTFIHRQHLCLVFELLSVNLYEFDQAESVPRAQYDSGARVCAAAVERVVLVE